MLKVLHLIPGLAMGGAETLVKDYALLIDKTKFEINIICLFRQDTPYEKILADAGINVIYLSDYIALSKKNNFAAKALSKVMQYFAVRKFIKAIKPDVIHTHLRVNTYIKFAAPNKNTRVFHMIHSEPSNSLDNSFMGKLEFNALKFLIKNFNLRFITLHERMQREINNLFNVNDTLILNNGIDFARFDNAKDKALMRRELNIQDDAFVIGHVGRFNAAKNHDLLVKIFKEICRLNAKAFLLMVGDGELREFIEHDLKDYQDKYLILSDRTDVPDILSAMDVFVFPSLYEGLGIALVDAQKMMLPCIISNTIPIAAQISNLCCVQDLNNPPLDWANACINFKPDKISLEHEKYS
ncbi:MAG: glycosyltransferase [Synergistaceae bacterium]|nr:glycosyltransferase [Synergistaceae bacterium]